MGSSSIHFSLFGNTSKQGGDEFIFVAEAAGLRTHIGACSIQHYVPRSNVAALDIFSDFAVSLLEKCAEWIWKT